MEQEQRVISDHWTLLFTATFLLKLNDYMLHVDASHGK